jgi:hypothetical protein
MTKLGDPVLRIFQSMILTPSICHWNLLVIPSEMMAMMTYFFPECSSCQVVVVASFFSFLPSLIDLTYLDYRS